MADIFAFSHPSFGSDHLCQTSRYFTDLGKIKEHFYGAGTVFQECESWRITFEQQSWLENWCELPRSGSYLLKASQHFMETQFRKYTISIMYLLA